MFDVASSGVSDHLAIAHPMVAGFEADDVMGTLATAAATARLPVTIVSALPRRP